MTAGVFVDSSLDSAFVEMTVGVIIDFSLDSRLRGNDSWGVC
jgi:hypothetical protein